MLRQTSQPIAVRPEQAKTSLPSDQPAKTGSMATGLKRCADSVRNFLSILKDAIVVVCLAAIILFPTNTKAYLRALGLTSVSTPLGQIDFAKDQVRGGTAILSQLESVRSDLPSDSEAAKAIETAISTLQASTVKAQDIVAEAQPSALPTKGWIYLGTLNIGGSAWAEGLFGRAATTVSESVANIKPNSLLRIKSDVNLRATRPGPNGTLPNVIGVVREGQLVRILDLDKSRPANRDQTNGSGQEVFANIQLLADQDSSR